MSNRYAIDKPFFALAPMANITTYPSAKQAARYGADLVWTPMVHTDTILNNWPEAERILDFKEIKNYLVQIVGSDPEKFSNSVKIIEKNLNPLGIDLNFACPDKNIVKSGCGGALMQDKENMIAIIKAVKKATELPVSVKTRAGWDNFLEIEDLTEEFIKQGIDLLTVHPRTVKQGFTGTADWSVVKKLKESYPDLMICGSGDILTWKEAIAKQKETGCDGVMIGRGALGRPWIFKEIKDEKDYVPKLAEIKMFAYEVARESKQIWGQKGLTECRKHFGYYFKGFDGAKEYREKLMKAENLAEIKKILEI